MKIITPEFVDAFNNEALHKQLKLITKFDDISHQYQKKLFKVLDAHPGDRNSLHEAWGFIREEMIELEAELIKKTPRYSQIADEAYDVMITCARLIAFCNDRLPQEFLPDLKNKDGNYPGHEDHF